MKMDPLPVEIGDWALVQLRPPGGPRRHQDILPALSTNVRVLRQKSILQTDLGRDILQKSHHVLGTGKGPPLMGMSMGCVVAGPS